MQQQRQYTIDIQNNVDKPQDNYAEYKQPIKIRVQIVASIRWNSRNCKLIYSDRKQIGGCLGCGRLEGEIMGGI